MEVTIGMSKTKVKTYVYCKTRFQGLHSWPGAPHSVHYLRNLHRHEFHVIVKCKTTSDRGIEFITLKESVDRYIPGLAKHWSESISCEGIAQAIGDALKYSSDAYPVVSVEVSEDGENGAIVNYE